MAFTQRQQEEYDRHFAALKSQESEALAMGLATFMVFSLFSTDLKERIIQDIKTNSSIIRHNKRVKTRNKKTERCLELANKNRLTKAENQEMLKLARELGFEG